MRKTPFTPGTRVVLPDGARGVVVPTDQFPAPTAHWEPGVVVVLLDGHGDPDDPEKFVPLTADGAYRYLARDEDGGDR